MHSFRVNDLVGSDPGVSDAPQPGPESGVELTKRARRSAYRPEFTVAAGTSQQPGVATTCHLVSLLAHGLDGGITRVSRFALRYQKAKRQHGPPVAVSPVASHGYDAQALQLARHGPSAFPPLS